MKERMMITETDSIILRGSEDLDKILGEQDENR